MANPARGEVALQAGDRTWTLDLSFNALCEIEDHFGKTITEVAQMLANPSGASAKTIRAVVWAGLQEHHPGTDLKEAGRVISEAGIEATMAAVTRAFQVSAPEAKGDPR